MRKFKQYLLLVTTTILVSFAGNVTTAFAEETPDYTLGRPMTEEEIAKQKSYEPKQFTTLPSFNVPASAKTYGAHGAYYPAKYDSRTYNIITPVKYQALTNWCWAYSAASVLETAMIKAGISDINKADLSEASLAYYMYHRNDNGLKDPLRLMIGDTNTYCDAYTYDYDFTMYSGNTKFVSEFLTTNMGVKYESYYTREQAENGILPDLYKAYTDQACVLKNAIYPASDKESIKSAIQTYGSICAAIYWDEYYYEGNDGYLYMNYDTSAYSYYDLDIDDNDNEDDPTNHEITIIGWDDNYSYTNFTDSSNVTTNGAWIAKNSWSDKWGNDGFFYISYEDNSLTPMVTFSVSAPNSYDNNYNYTGSSGNYQWYYYNCASTMYANVYTAKGREQITEVSFDSQSPDMDYSIQIYKNVSDKTRPDSGTPALDTPIVGKTTDTGIYTLPLTEAVYLDPGERYSIVVELFCPPNGNMAIGIEYYADYGWFIANPSLAQYQSFCKASDEKSWTDSYTKKYCARISAHTKNSDYKKVTFKDSNGKVINIQYVKPNGNADVSFAKKTGYSVTFNTIYTNITSDQNITVKWSANTYTISFDANKGKTSKKAINVKYNSKFGTLPTATRRYYKFEGWYTSSGRKITASLSNTYAKNITLTAKWSKVKVGTGNITKVTSPKRKAIKLNIKKISGATGYSIQYSTKKNMKNAKTVNTTSTSKTIGNLKSGKTYYVRVRAIKKDSTGQKVYGNYSAVKSIKVK